LQRFFEQVVRKMLGVSGRMLDRRHDGDRVLVVNSDMGLYRINDVYGDDLCLGNLRTQSLGEILSSERYRESLARDAEVLARTCAGCPYAGPCSGSPLFEFAPVDPWHERCGLPFELLKRIEHRVRAAGVDQAYLHSLLPARTSATL
jgi:radical SAM protein with 4Fe4S-binding SPASM domain